MYPGAGLNGTGILPSSGPDRVWRGVVVVVGEGATRAVFDCFDLRHLPVMLVPDMVLYVKEEMAHPELVEKGGWAWS
jgi:hypothetical protein